MTMNMTDDQCQWAQNWIAGLRDGSLTAAAGFIRKLGPLGLSTEDMATLTDLYVQHGVAKLCDVVELVLFNGVTVLEAVQVHVADKGGE